MNFFFIKDYRQKYRYFSSDPVREVQVHFSKLKKIWELAKKKLMLLPQKILRQEQAFGMMMNLKTTQVQIFNSGSLEDKKLKIRFFFFLQKQRTKHVFLLVFETLLLPLSGLAALLPGPNVFFGALALLMITHWRALRGINRLLKTEHVYVGSPLIAEWEEAVKSKNEDRYPLTLNLIAEEYGLENIRKILWK